MDNAVTLTGNVTRDPELKFTASGASVASFGLAVSRKWRKDDDWHEQTSFFDVTCWSQMAENVCQSITKGTRVMVVGRLEQQSWENDNGEKRSKVAVIADDVGPSLRWATCHVDRIDRSDAPSRAAGTPVLPSGEEPF